MEQSDPLAEFVNDMLAQKQLPGVDEAVHAQLVSDLRNRLMDQIDQAVVEALPADKVDGFNDLLDREAQDTELQQYIADSGVDVRRVTMETMLRFRALYLGGSTQG